MTGLGIGLHAEEIQFRRQGWRVVSGVQCQRRYRKRMTGCYGCDAIARQRPNDKYRTGSHGIVVTHEDIERIVAGGVEADRQWQRLSALRSGFKSFLDDIRGFGKCGRFKRKQ